MSNIPSAKKNGSSVKKTVVNNHPSSSHYPKYVVLPGANAPTKSGSFSRVGSPYRRFGGHQQEFEARLQQLPQATNLLLFKARLTQLSAELIRLSVTEMEAGIAALVQLLKQEPSRERRNRLSNLLEQLEEAYEAAKFELDPTLRERLRAGAEHFARKAQSSFPAIPLRES